MRIAITILLLGAASVFTLACAAKRPAASVTHHLVIQNVKCEQQSDGTIDCSCDYPQSVLDAADPTKATFRCADGKR